MSARPSVCSEGGGGGGQPGSEQRVCSHGGHAIHMNLCTWRRDVETADRKKRKKEKKTERRREPVLSITQANCPGCILPDLCSMRIGTSLCYLKVG